ncbi:MAG: VOC family protein [Hyphomicrobiaceae bacterium]
MVNRPLARLLLTYPVHSKKSFPETTMDATINRVRPQAIADPGIDVQRRRLFCGLLASGSLLVAAPKAHAVTIGDDTANIGTVWWSELVSGDVPKALGFYSKVIGWETKTVGLEDAAQPVKDGEPSYTLMLAQGNEVAGALPVDTDDPAKKAPMWLTYFQVDDVDAAVKRATAAGGTVLISPFDVGKIARMAVIADPEGVRVGLAHPL